MRTPPRRRNPIARRIRFYRLVFDRRFASNMPSYLFQCGLATFSMIIIIMVEDVIFRPVIVLAVASTAFIIFMVPHSTAATPRKVIGGHLVAVLVGSALVGCLRLLGVDSGVGEGMMLNAAAALSVGLGMFIMVITNAEHPPAAATALALIIQGWNLSAIVFILTGAVILSAIRIILRPRLVNLL